MTDLARSATAFMDRLWDDAASLLRYPDDPRHAVRESAWYALGLLMRDEPGDVDRARRALRMVVENQYHDRGAPFHGTFARAPEEQYPANDAVVWRDYDPNWRQFIGCTFALLIDDFSEALGDDLCRTLVRSVLLAVDSEPSDRILPSYSNIALMRAWLDAWSGTQRRGEALARSIAAEVDAASGFAEFNSPTYYGVDLFALSLWRTRPPSELFESLGAVLESRLWRDIGDFYHPGFRNLCGPWTRSYGMDARRYVALFAMYLPDALPDLKGPFGHAHDFCFGPLAEFVPTQVPDGVIQQDVARSIVRPVAGMQVTAVMDADVMWGALALKPPDTPQMHPATAHWKTEDGGTGWLRVRSRGDLHGVAIDSGLYLEVGDQGATAEVFPDASRLAFSRPPHETFGTKHRFGPGVLEIEILR